MKFIQNKVEETVLLTPNEYEMFKQLLENCMYYNAHKKIDLYLRETGAESKEDGVVTRHWEVVNEFDKEKHFIVIDLTIDENWKDNQTRINSKCASVDFDETTGRAITDEWSELVRKVVGRCINYADAKENAHTVVPSGLNPIMSADILGKSYFLYMEIIRVKDGKGKPHEMPGPQFMKLVSSVNKLDDKIINSIQPMPSTPNWVSYGKRPKGTDLGERERAAIVLPIDTLCKEYGISKTDKTAFWNLIEQRKIHPVWMCAPTIEQCVQQSNIVTENILAENKINPKFTKTNLIV